jgi:hypothetical protein
MTSGLKTFLKSGALALLVLVSEAAATETQAQMPPIGTPLPQPDFHFSDQARDARYWQLYADAERAMSEFREADGAASAAVALPAPQPGTPAWLEARRLVEAAILVRQRVRAALDAMIYFLRGQRPLVPPEEAESAYEIIRVWEGSQLATSDHLVDLLGRLAGFRFQHWPP